RAPLLVARIKKIDPHKMTTATTTVRRPRKPGVHDMAASMRLFTCEAPFVLHDEAGLLLGEHRAIFSGPAVERRDAGLAVLRADVVSGGDAEPGHAPGALTGLAVADALVGAVADEVRLVLRPEGRPGELAQHVGQRRPERTGAVR